MEKEKRSYAKESTKTNPSGIRFDIEQLEFIQKKELKLTTKQKVVDFLLNKFWWEHKIPMPSHKGLPPENDFNGGSKVTQFKTENNFGTEMELPKEKTLQTANRLQIKRSPAQWVELRRETNSTEELMQWEADLANDTFLTTEEKRQIKATN